MEKKYHNYAQLVQGVAQVNDPTLSQGERLFLDCLAGYCVKTYPHPGNEKLARACGITTKQGVRKIAHRLINRGLIEIREVGNGRGNATIYRIITEDPRFPLPKQATDELPVYDDKEEETTELPVSEKGATGDSGRDNSQSGKGQLDHSKGATVEFPTDLKNGLKNEYKTEDAANAASCDPQFNYEPEPTDHQLADQFFKVRNFIIAQGESVVAFDREHRHHCERLGLREIWEAIDMRNARC